MLAHLQTFIVGLLFVFPLGAALGNGVSSHAGAPPSNGHPIAPSRIPLNDVCFDSLQCRIGTDKYLRLWVHEIDAYGNSRTLARMFPWKSGDQKAADKVCQEAMNERGVAECNPFSFSQLPIRSSEKENLRKELQKSVVLLDMTKPLNDALACAVPETNPDPKISKDTGIDTAALSSQNQKCLDGLWELYAQTLDKLRKGGARAVGIDTDLPPPINGPGYSHFEKVRKQIIEEKRMGMVQSASYGSPLFPVAQTWTWNTIDKKRVPGEAVILSQASLTPWFIKDGDQFHWQQGSEEGRLPDDQLPFSVRLLRAAGYPASPRQLMRTEIEFPPPKTGSLYGGATLGLRIPRPPTWSAEGPQPKLAGEQMLGPNFDLSKVKGKVVILGGEDTDPKMNIDRHTLAGKETPGTGLLMAEIQTLLDPNLYAKVPTIVQGVLH